MLQIDKKQMKVNDKDQFLMESRIVLSAWVA